MDCVSSVECFATGYAGFWHGHDPVVDFHGAVCCELASGWTKLCSDHHQSANEGHVHDTASIDNLGLHGYSDSRCFEFPRFGFSGCVIVDGPDHGNGVLLV